MSATDLGTVNEGTTRTLGGLFSDDAGDAIDPNDLVYLRATLYEKKSLDIINLRDHQSFLGENGGQVLATPDVNNRNLYLRLDPEDNAIVSTKKKETHVLLVEWSWMDGAVQKYSNKEFSYTVQNLEFVPEGS